MKSTLVKEAILASKSLMKNTQELPTLSAIEFEMVSHKQQLESFFSDSIHSIYVMRGKNPRIIYTKLGNKVESRMINRVKVKNLSSFCAWMTKLGLDEPLVNFQSADVNLVSLKWNSNRTFLASQLENDVKFRLAIHEFYMDRVNTILNIYFNKGSYNNARGRETLLRLNYLPIRVVKRLVNKNEN